MEKLQSKDFRKQENFHFYTLKNASHVVSFLRQSFNWLFLCKSPNLPLNEIILIRKIFNFHLYNADKENRNNRFEGKRVLDARKPQEGPRESREERNNRRNKAPGEVSSAPGGGADGERRGGLGGRGGPRGGRGGGRGGRGGPMGGRGKRDFDRKSGDDKT